ncbi:MAG: hypothetical protein HQK78_16865 [Desulfobacterales bacterium]|nr:hypothetical protein [Desulfobacterales bacterium]
MQKVIVSNTGPLISLEKLRDGYGFIRKIYREILIPLKVAEEISEGYENVEAYLDRYQITDLISIKQVTEIVGIAGIESLDEGEIEAISLAVESGLELLIEETMGRSIALNAGIKISGIAGQIGYAFNSGLISKEEAEENLRTLLKSGRINNAVYHAISNIIS